MEAVSAGNNFLKGDYTKAAMQYLAAGRMEAYVKEEGKKVELMSKAIAFIFIAPIAIESHKIICSLCLSEPAKKSPLYPLVTKLYREEIFTAEEVKKVEGWLPGHLGVKDSEGISRMEQAAFCRNMIPIINSFSSIKFNTLLRLIGGTSIKQLLLLLEKTYQRGEVSIDQVTETVYIKDTVEASELVKDFLTQIDDILAE